MATLIPSLARQTRRRPLATRNWANGRGALRGRLAGEALIGLARWLVHRFDFPIGAKTQ
jgi:hypothetical protein